MGFNRSF